MDDDAASLMAHRVAPAALPDNVNKQATGVSGWNGGVDVLHLCFARTGHRLSHSKNDRGLQSELPIMRTLRWPFVHFGQVNPSTTSHVALSIGANGL